MEQPEAVIRSINNGGRIESNSSVKLGGLESNKDILVKLNHIVILGCGTSYHAGLWALSIYKSLDIFDTVTIYDGAEFTIKDIPKSIRQEAMAPVMKYLTPASIEKSELFLKQART
jgi:glucosamine--fructose-6-phosphate aminotransferase (isomerizing)